MPTRSKPMVSCTPIAWAIATFVPMPSVEVARTGCCIAAIRPASKSPAKPPIPPITSGRRVLPTHSFIRSTARSPASMSTPAAAYADCSLICGLLAPTCQKPAVLEHLHLLTGRGGASGAAEGVGGADTDGHRLEAVDVGADRRPWGGVLKDVLAQPLAQRQLDG